MWVFFLHFAASLLLLIYHVFRIKKTCRRHSATSKKLNAIIPSQLSISVCAFRLTVLQRQLKYDCVGELMKQQTKQQLSKPHSSISTSKYSWSPVCKL